jgi:hypothetical protein
MYLCLELELKEVKKEKFSNLELKKNLITFYYLFENIMVQYIYALNRGRG